MAIIRLYIVWERSWVQYATTIKIKNHKKPQKIKTKQEQKTKTKIKNQNQKVTLYTLFSRSDIWVRLVLGLKVGVNVSEEPGTSWIRSKLQGVTNEKSSFHSQRSGWKDCQCQWECKVHRCLSRMCVRSDVINNFSGSMWVQHALSSGAFANLRKTTISVVLSDCLFVRMEQLCSHWTAFHEIWYLNIFRKYS